LVAAWVLLALLAGGCETLLGRYSTQQLERVGSELTTVDSIYAELGPADLRREGGRFWIYTWEAVPFSPSILVIEFDADGRLVNKELARGTKPSQGGMGGLSPNARYCTDGGTCLEHAIDTGDGGHFDDIASTVSVQGPAQSRIRPPELRAEECLLVIFPSKAWNKSQTSIPPPEGVAVSVEGAPRWSYPRWLPTGAFARIVLPAGEHVVSVRDPVWAERMADQGSPPEGLGKDVDLWVGVLDFLLSPPSEEHDKPPSAATFQCRAGERVFLEIDAGFKAKGRHWFPIVLREVDAAAAQVLIANMRQVLPPDY
jgi:hypothetical protein